MIRGEIESHRAASGQFARNPRGDHIFLANTITCRREYPQGPQRVAGSSRTTNWRPKILVPLSLDPQRPHSERGSARRERVHPDQVLRFRCVAMPDGGRMLTYMPITDLIRRTDDPADTETLLAQRAGHGGADWIAHPAAAALRAAE